MNLKVDNNIIKAICYDAETLKRGEELFYTNATKMVKTEQDGEEQVLIASIEDDGLKQVTIHYDFKYGIVGDMCSCKKTGCEHIVCTLLNYVKEAGSKYNKSVVREVKNELTLMFRQKQSGSIIANDNDKVKIYPLIDIVNGYVIFKIGRKKEFIIKDLNVFKNVYENNENFLYAKELEFVHYDNVFSDTALKYVDFICTQVENIKYYNKDAVVKHIDMQKWNIDKLYSIAKDSKSYIKLNKDEVVELEVCEDISLLDIKYSLVFDENSVSVINSKVNFYGCDGEHDGYIFIDNKMFKVPSYMFDCINNMQKVFDFIKTDTVTFVGNEISEFLSYVLPTLKNCNLLDSDYDSELYEFEYYELVTKIYIDTIQHDVIATVVFMYGDREITEKDEVVYRNLQKEFEIVDNLQYYGFEQLKYGNYILRSDDNIYRLYDSGLDALRLIAEVYITDKIKNYLYTLMQTIPKIDVSMDNNLLDVSVQYDNYDMQDLVQALKSYKSKKKYHRFDDGSYITFDREEVKDMLELVYTIDSSIADSKNIPLYRAFYIENFISKAKNIDVEVENSFIEFIKNLKNYKNIEIHTDNTDAILRDYQMDGIKWLTQLSEYGLGGVLADDMGLGKTLQVIAMLSEENANKDIKALVVVPTSLVYNWQSEILKFSKNLMPVLLIGKAEDRQEGLSEEGNVYITTYDMLRRDIDLYKDIYFDYLIADEVQYIKNHTTKTAKAIKSVGRRCTFALTGTPIQNSLSELWSIFDLVLPGYLYKYSVYNNNYMKPIVVDDNKQILELLKKQISPFIVRRLKKDVLKDLPDKIESTIVCDMTKEQERIYMAYLLEARGELKDFINNDEMGSNSINIMAKITRLRQIACHPALVSEDYKYESGKIQVLMETIKNVVEQGHRALVFSQFTSMLDIIMKNINEDGEIKYFYLDGKTKPKERLESSMRFNNGERDVFLISLKAGGVGLNLTGADVVIHFDPWWNPAIMEQATDRAYRYGQKKVVQVINIIAKDTVEEKILQMQERKKGLIDKVIEDNVDTLAKLSEDDIKWLFEL